MKISLKKKFFKFYFLTIHAFFFYLLHCNEIIPLPAVKIHSNCIYLAKKKEISDQ